MKRIQIDTVNHPSFSSMWKIYESSFPLSERRDLEDQKRIFLNKTYYLEAWIDEENVVGIIGWWDCGDIYFVEHYAIASENRSSGYGGTFLSEWLTNKKKPVLLEIEPVVDEITQRRKSFYMKLGFTQNKIQHYQPPYHKETGKVELWVLSFPRLLSEEEYNRFHQKQQDEIMPILIL